MKIDRFSFGQFDLKFEIKAQFEMVHICTWNGRYASTCFLQRKLSFTERKGAVSDTHFEFAKHAYDSVLSAISLKYCLWWETSFWLKFVQQFSFCFVLSCLVCTVLGSALLLDAGFCVHFFLGSPDISYFISTDFDRNQLLWPTCNQDLPAVASI